MESTAETEMVRAEAGTMATALAEHHRGLQKAIENIIVRCDCDDGGDPAILRPAWEAFERDLLRHLEIEERELLPLFAQSYPHEAAGLNKEHDEIREFLFELGMALERHQSPLEALHQLASHLRAHAAREDLALYPWLEMNLSADAWHTMGGSLPLPFVTPAVAAGRS